MGSTSSDNAIVVSDIRRSTSSGRRSNQLSPQPRPSQAEVALNAISELLERHKNNHRPQRSASQTDSDDAKTVDTELSIDHNFRLVAEVAAIVKNYQVGKEFPRSGIAGEDSEEDIQLPDGAAGPAHLIKRVSNTDTDALNKFQLKETTHPVIHTEDHVDKFNDFVQDMLAAGRRKRQKLRYTKVEVLLLSWEEDEGAGKEVKRVNKLIEDEIRTVHELFERTLNFSVNRYAIPLVDPRTKRNNKWQTNLQRKVAEFVEYHDDPGTLLILYYNGHGSCHGNSCYWHPTEEASEVYSGYRPDLQFYGPHLEWNPIQNSISTDCDVLIVLDCCYAGASLLNSNKGRSPTTQILTACSKGQKTPAGPNSFTMRFVKAVNDILATSKTRIPITELYGLMVGSNITPQPFHVQRGPGNIVLERLPDPNAPELEQFLRTEDQGKERSRGSSFSGVDANTVFSSTLKPADAAITDQSSVSSTTSSLLVTLVVRVKEDVTPTAANWEHILDALPPDEAAELKSVKVEVEAALPTDSTMLIVTIPMAYWLLLPENPAYSFLGFVKGHNKLLPPKARTEEQSVLKSIQRSNSDEVSFANDGEADVIRQLVDAMLEFFQKMKSSDHAKERRPGRFQHMATRIGLHPPSPKTPRLETDPHFATISQLVQKLIIVRNEKGEYTGLSYDLNFTVAKLFELTKKNVKETIHKVSPRNGGELEATITTEFDQLEKEVLTKLEEDKKGKAYSIDPRISIDHAKAWSKSHTRSKSSASKVCDTPIPEDGLLTPRASAQFSSRSKPASVRGEIAMSMRKDSLKTDSLDSTSSHTKRADSGFESMSGRGTRRPKFSNWRSKSSNFAVKDVGETARKPVRLSSSPGRTVRGSA